VCERGWGVEKGEKGEKGDKGREEKIQSMICWGEVETAGAKRPYC